MTYYTAVILLVWMALAILAAIVHENDTISRKDRQTSAQKLKKAAVQRSFFDLFYPKRNARTPSVAASVGIETAAP